jgi:hypothetical protein
MEMPDKKKIKRRRSAMKERTLVLEGDAVTAIALNPAFPVEVERIRFRRLPVLVVFHLHGGAVEAVFPRADIPAARASLRIHPLVAEAVPAKLRLHRRR